MKWTPMVILSAAALASPAGAAPAPPAGRPPALQAVVDCRQVADDAKRLACYDAAVAGMTKAEESGDLVAIDREQRRAVRRQAFGFALPSLDLLERGSKPDRLDHVAETVAAAWRSGDGKWVMRMEDGEVWRQTDDYELSRDPHAGSKIVIKNAMLGSFMANIDGQPLVRVHRDN